MSETDDKQPKKKTPLVWIVFTLIVPGAVALVLTFVVLSYAGVDVVDWAKTKMAEAPLIFNDANENDGSKKDRVTERDEHWQQKISKKNETIDELNKDLQQLESENRALQQDVEKAEAAADNKNKEMASSIAQTLNNMTSKHAAEIINNLGIELAAPILNELSNEARGDIMEVMEPEQAAKLTERLFEQ